MRSASGDDEPQFKFLAAENKSSRPLITKEFPNPLDPRHLGQGFSIFPP